LNNNENLSQHLNIPKEENLRKKSLNPVKDELSANVNILSMILPEKALMDYLQVG
jgi:hypothetical protein